MAGGFGNDPKGSSRIDSQPPVLRHRSRVNQRGTPHHDVARFGSRDFGQCPLSPTRGLSSTEPHYHSSGKSGAIPWSFDNPAIGIGGSRSPQLAWLVEPMRFLSASCPGTSPRARSRVVIWRAENRKAKPDSNTRTLRPDKCLAVCGLVSFSFSYTVHAADLLLKHESSFYGSHQTGR